MDVTCERCSTAYEFDDALVSERGTTVKCTNCGFQFKVRRTAEASSPERWLVRTIDGREIEFRALRELQGAIVQSTISREDVLSRGGSRPRRLGSIAELEPFFSRAGQAGPSNAGGASEATRRSTASFGTRTRAAPSATATPLPGVIVSPVGAPMPPSVGRPKLDSVSNFDEGASPTYEATRTSNGRVASRAETIPDGAAARARLSPVDAAPPSTRASTRSSVSAQPSPHEDAKAVARADARPSDPRTSQLPRLSENGSPSLNALPTPPPSIGRVPDFGEDSIIEPGRRTGARWIVGFVVAGTLALTFAVVGRKYLAPSATPQPAASSARDERVSALLREGEESLLEGDLEGAKEHFDKASVFSERDPRVSSNLAHLAMVRADIAWLRVRLLPENDADLGAARHELEQIVQRAQKAAERAADLAPNDPAVIRTRIDAYRLNGDLDAARRLVSGIASAATQPDNALALAELDLAEAKPDWATVISRLRVAVSGDQNLGRARAMLVYALARSGDLTSARAEVERLASLPRPHPLLRPLRAFLAREGGAAAPDASASAAGQPPAKAGAPAAPGPGRDREPTNTGSARPDGRIPDDYVAPNGVIDTSDLPGMKPAPAPPAGDAPHAPPTPPTAAPHPATPPGVDTSDLPGFK